MTDSLTQELATETGAVRARGLLRRSLGLWRTRVGVALTLLIVLLAVFGPLLAPHSGSDLVGAPFQGRGGDLPLGADHLGQDVWSRFLDGGLSILVVAAVSTALGLLAGVVVGIWAGLAGGRTEKVLLQVTDVLLAFPQILLALIVIATVGPKTWLVVLTVALTTMPRTVRVIRGAASSVIEREFIDAARAIGDPTLRIVFVEVLPNVLGSLVVEATFRFTYAIQLIAALAFLGFATDPNAPNWGTDVSANASALTLQPAASLVPAAAIALVTVGIGLIGEGLARAAAGLDRSAS